MKTEYNPNLQTVTLEATDADEAFLLGVISVRVKDAETSIGSNGYRRVEVPVINLVKNAAVGPS